jgi:hypothetical protein
MGAFTDLVFGWEVFGFGVSILLFVGGLMVSDEFKHFKAARVSFMCAGAWTYGKVLMWGALTSESFKLRAIVVAIACAAVGVGLVELMRVTTKRERLAAHEPLPATPDLSSIASDLEAIKKNTTPVPDRHLTIDQIQYLRARLKGHKKQPLRVSFLVGDVESQRYAQEFVSVLGSPPLDWEAGLGLPSQFNFSGVAVAVQDPTDVPPAAEDVASSLEALGIKVLRVPAFNAVSIDGNRASPIFSLWISAKGETTPQPRNRMRLHVRYVDTGTPVESMKNSDLRAAAHDLGDAMRAFEADNKEQLASEWHIAGRPLEKGSYRFVFEGYRKRALAIRAELWRRLNSQPATTFALDADYLGGAAPVTDAANYLDELAKQLPDDVSAKRP